MWGGNAAENKMRESLEPWRVVSSPLLEVFKQRLDGYLSPGKLWTIFTKGYKRITGKAYKDIV